MNMGWITDFFRLAWGLFYWNARKTVYRRRLKQGRGRCPDSCLPALQPLPLEVSYALFEHYSPAP
jgi:hypothetical protein